MTDQPVQPVESDSKGFIPTPGNEDEGQVVVPDPVPESDASLTVTDRDEEDVEAALARDTQDGSGFEKESELPPSDFEGFATDNVEEETQ